MQHVLRNWIIAFLIGGVCFALFQPINAKKNTGAATEIAAAELAAHKEMSRNAVEPQMAEQTSTEEQSTEEESAEEQPDTAEKGLHSVQVRALDFSLLRVTVDGKSVFSGQLKLGAMRQWSGTEIVLWASNAGAIEILLDEQFTGVLGDAKDAFGLRWPTEDVLPSTIIDIADLPPGPAEPLFYIVQLGDSLSQIAQGFALEAASVANANGITDADQIGVGMQLAIPSRDGHLPDANALRVTSFISNEELAVLAARPTIVERQTKLARQAPRTSPYYKTTWVAYYGRPNIPVMGILGEHDIETLTELLKDQSAAYDEANGDELGVMPAFHLVYGMATKEEGEDGDHLTFMSDEAVQAYIDVAQRENFAVILDIQIGALTPLASLEYGLPWLKYAQVHLGIDPEFAKVHPGQAWPGMPIGYVTAAQVNAVQSRMQNYMQEHEIEGSRVLLVHQFQSDMIRDKADLDWGVPQVDLTLSVDGWGPPSSKIHKYNALVEEGTEFSAFKLFYSWDEPLLNEAQALGEEPYGAAGFIEVTPNMIMYQ